LRSGRQTRAADLALAELDQERSFVMAPIAGPILDIGATPDQRPPAGGIMDMGDTSQILTGVEVWQDRIASIDLTVSRLGQAPNDAAENKDSQVIRVLDAASSAVAVCYMDLEVVAPIDTIAGKRKSHEPPFAGDLRTAADWLTATDP
jgi:HlyD family secretion protein